MAVSDELEVCRDFQKGDCSRGDGCKFSHPKLEVCRDFQTKGCGRANCKFVHVTREEEILYENSGKLPDHLNKDAGNNNGVMNKPFGGIQDFGGMYGKRLRADSLDLMAGFSPMAKKPFVPENQMMGGSLCRDFDKANCSRGERCKYYHPKLKICRDFQNNKCERETCRFLHITRDEEDSYENSGKIPDHIAEETAKKNRIMDATSGRGADRSNLSGLAAVPESVMQENQMLKQKLAELQRQIMDLHKMNDTLYEQNATYRNGMRGTTGGI